jgi:hypothetical protein
MVVRRGAGQTSTMSTGPRPGVRGGPWRWSSDHPCRWLPPCTLVGVARTLAEGWGCRGGSQLRQRCGWWWEDTRAGSTAHAGSWERVTVPRGQVAAWSRGAWSCTLRRGVSCAAWGHSVESSGVGQAAVSAVSQPSQRQGARAAGRLSTARWGPVPSSQAPGVVSVAMVHGPAGVPASCSPGGAGGVTAGGPRDTQAPASVSSPPTWACRRRRTASARPSLPLFAAPEA